MAKIKLIAVCQSGGNFTSNSDGSLSYAGGDAHAMSINAETKFDELKAEVAEMWKYDPNSLTVKYFIPHNKKSLITISSDKDLQHLLDFHRNSPTVDIYALSDENQTSYQTMSHSRSRMVDEPVTPDSFTHAASVSGDTEQLDWLASASLSRDENHPDNLTSEAPCDNNNGLQKLVKSWENCLTGLEQQFNNVQDFRVALNKFSIAHGFEYTFKTNNARYVIANCKGEGCPWSIQAARLSTTKLFFIKKMSETHSCGAGKSPLVTSKLVKFLVKEKLQDAPHAKPREIADEIRQKYGVKARYAQIWRGIETTREKLQVPCEEGYNELPSLFKQIIENNPGSTATVITREDSSFHRLFVSFQASLHGFKNGCRPLLFLDSVTINSKYQSELLTATALDGNDGIFPVAFAVVDVVDDDNWHWFLVELKSALSTFQQLTFVADREIGLKKPISMTFKNSHHAYCLHRLREDLKRDLGGSYTEETLQVIVSSFDDAARATALDGFKRSIENIRNISPEAREWILQSGPEHWANALFQGSRYGHFSSDVAKALYSWVTELPALPIAKLIETICRKIKDLMDAQQSNSGHWSTRLTPVVESNLQEEILKANMLQVLVSPSSTFEVCDSLGAINVVNTDLWDCGCREWQLNGFPCCHAVAVLQRTERSLYDYCSEYYTIDAFRSTYSNSINLVATTDGPVQKKSSKIEVRPPLLSASGHPKKRRIRNRHKGPFKRALHCSKCQGAGHNRATCHITSYSHLH